MNHRDFSRDFSLENKTAVITGASSGIGLSIARMYAEKGANIVVYDLNPSNELEHFVTGLNRKYLFVKGDISKVKEHAQSVEGIINRTGKVDILVNCAGVGLIDDAENISEEMWDKTMNVNIKGLFFFTQQVGRSMIKNGGGKIISIASQAGIVALDQHIAYGVAKAGIIYMTKLLGYEWGEFNIQTNAVSPTIVLTPLGERVWDNEKGDRFKKQIPTGRFAYPEEVAACAVFLASDGAAMINGENLVIDGGYTIQ